MEKEVLRRYSEPNSYDHAPYGTLCVVRSRNEVERTYIQTSKDDEHPHWVLVDENGIIPLS